VVAAFVKTQNQLPSTCRDSTIAAPQQVSLGFFPFRVPRFLLDRLWSLRHTRPMSDESKGDLPPKLRFDNRSYGAVSREPKGHLPRLLRHHYQGHAVVFWTFTLAGHARGWLTAALHGTFRELLLHAAAREHLFCPAYCLMPDHLHLVWMGLRRESDQLNAVRFLRRHLTPALGPDRKWQHQAHDHVLREDERRRDAFARTCFYVLANPVRARLVERERDWPYLGAVVPGYPDLQPLAENFWKTFWKLYAQAREAEPSPPAKPPLSP
jgi:REP element-mobilizing transposase RayT